MLQGEIDKLIVIIGDSSSFPRAQGTFVNIDHILDHKTSINKCERIHITHGIKLEINNR
jgi:hypothetical protein